MTVARGRRLAAGLAACIAVVLTPAPAWAHVTVNPPEAPKGGFTKLTFRAPNERPDASTVKLEVAFPTDHPIASVGVRPQPGWNYSVERAPLATPIRRESGDVTEAVSTITWTAASPDSAIKPGEFAEFDVSAGPLPADADELVFKALQTYSSGEVVRWIEERTPGGEEPEHPAPVLTLAEAAEGATATTTPSDGSGPAVAARDIADQDDVDGARAVGIVGIVVGVLGLLAGGAALLRARRPASATAPKGDD